MSDHASSLRVGILGSGQRAAGSGQRAAGSGRASAPLCIEHFFEGDDLVRSDVDGGDGVGASQHESVLIDIDCEAGKRRIQDVHSVAPGF